MLYIHTLPPLEAHTHTVILLHGRGSVGSEFAEEFFFSQTADEKILRELFPGFKWVFPSSAIRDCARFGGRISQWFDIWSIEDREDGKGVQRPGLIESVGSILEIVEQEAAIVGADKIILGGISQGCATAAHVLLQGAVRLGAFIGLCGYLPFRAEIEEIARSSATKEERQNRLRTFFLLRHTLKETPNLALDTPVLLEHSKDDDTVKFEDGEKLCAVLKELGMSVEWHAYEDGGHWVNEPQGVEDMVTFLRRVC